MGRAVRALPALAGLRSKHNTYLSVPLIYTMVVQHHGALNGQGWQGLVAVVAVGWCVTWWIYKKSASPATTAY